MGTETMVEELRELIAGLAHERVRAGEEDGDGLDIHLELDPCGPVVAIAAPAPPATAADIAQAESALGRPYPPELRALLEVANGFPGYFYGDTLLGTSGVGTAGVAGYPAQFPASIWGIARECIDEWYDSEEGRLEFSPEDRLDCIPLASDPDSSGAVFVVASSGPGWDAGTVVEFEGGVHRYESVREYLRARLELVREA